MNTQEFITLLLASIGGTSAIILGLSAFLGNVWAKRIEQREKRISDAQFSLYVDVWNKLQDVKMYGDKLWEKASRDNIEIFAEALANAIISINKGRIILRERHYQRLITLLSIFENYKVGKSRLADLYGSEKINLLDPNYDSSIFLDQIDINKSQKKDYEKLLDEILADFRQQLSLAA